MRYICVLKHCQANGAILDSRQLCKVQREGPLRTELAKSSQAMLQETANPEDGGLVRVPDNCFFSFEELAEIPCKTASKVSAIKQQLINHLTPIYP